MRCAVLLLATVLPFITACSTLPGQGFATRALGGTVADAVPGTAQPARSEVYTVPAPVGGEGLTRSDPCIDAARARADETKQQGFDEVTQKQVYDATFADCRKWRSHE